MLDEPEKHDDFRVPSVASQQVSITKETEDLFADVLEHGKGKRTIAPKSKAQFEEFVSLPPDLSLKDTIRITSKKDLQWVSALKDEYFSQQTAQSERIRDRLKPLLTYYVYPFSLLDFSNTQESIRFGRTLS